MLKKRIISWLIIVSVVIVGLNITAGIMQANNSSKAFGILIDNQTGEDITTVRLKVRAYDEKNGKSYEGDISKTFKEMLPGNYAEFTFDMNSPEYASAEKSDLTIIVKTKDEESLTVQDAIGMPIKEGKKTLIKLVGDRTSGFKVEFVHFLKA